MAVIRLTHVAELPSPEELIRKLQDTPPPPMPPSGGGGGMPMGGVQTQAMGASGAMAPPSGGPTASMGNAVTAIASDQALARYPTWEHVLDLIRANRDVKLLVEVEAGVRLAAYQPGRIEFTPAENTATDLAARLGTALHRWTGNRWAVSIVNDCTAETVTEARDAAARAEREEAAQHPLIQAVLAAFPKAEIKQIHSAKEAETAALMDALPEVEDEWDPFEE
jgi:DNA polymerase-3 subunit gamma/tau